MACVIFVFLINLHRYALNLPLSNDVNTLMALKSILQNQPFGRETLHTLAEQRSLLALATYFLAAQFGGVVSLRTLILAGNIVFLAGIFALFYHLLRRQGLAAWRSLPVLLILCQSRLADAMLSSFAVYQHLLPTLLSLTAIYLVSQPGWVARVIAGLLATVAALSSETGLLAFPMMLLAAVLPGCLADRSGTLAQAAISTRFSRLSQFRAGAVRLLRDVPVSVMPLFGFLLAASLTEPARPLYGTLGLLVALLTVLFLAQRYPVARLAATASVFLFSTVFWATSYQPGQNRFEQFCKHVSAANYVHQPESDPITPTPEVRIDNVTVRSQSYFLNEEVQTEIERALAAPIGPALPARLSATVQRGSTSGTHTSSHFTLRMNLVLLPVTAAFDGAYVVLQATDRSHRLIPMENSADNTCIQSRAWQTGAFGEGRFRVGICVVYSGKATVRFGDQWLTANPNTVSVGR